MKKERKKKPGPEPERLKLKGDWKQLVKKALAKPPPKIKEHKG